MSFVFKMPDVGEGIAEGEIVQWFVKEGDTIAEDAPLLEVQNDKLLQEIPSPVSGVIKKILVPAGTVSNVGDVLVEIDAEGHSSATEAAAPVAVEAKTEVSTGGSTFVFKLPDVGEGIAEGEIAQWFVKVGDTVSEDSPLLEVQNDKLLQEIPSPVSGTILKILVEPGTVSTVGDPLVEIAIEGAAPVTKNSTVVTPTAVDKPVATASVPTGVAGNEIAGRVLALPSVRQYARKLGVDLSKVVATGKRGHILTSDIDAFVGGTQVAPVTSAETPAKAPVTQTTALEPARPITVQGSVTREKMTPTRRAIAKAMVNSKAKAPHVTLFDEVEVSRLVNHRKRFKDVAAEQDVKLTFLPYIVKALVSVVRKYPILNSSVDDTTDEIVYKNFYNIGIATDTAHGLYVPNIKNADTKGIFTIAKEISVHAKNANDGKLSGADMREGTVTISNIGSARGLWFTPIINHPEVAILGVGRIDKKPIVLEDGTVGVGNMLALSLSFDHRVIDGMTAQLAMNEVKRLLSDPELLLMEV